MATVLPGPQGGRQRHREAALERDGSGLSWHTGSDRLSLTPRQLLMTTAIRGSEVIVSGTRLLLPTKVPKILFPLHNVPCLQSPNPLLVW